MAKNDFNDEDRGGRIFMQGYRKFSVALLWSLLVVFVVVWCMLTTPTAGQVTIAVWTLAAGGFFCSFFVGGNVLAQIWANNYKVTTSANLSESRSVSESTNRNYSTEEDTAWTAEDKLPPESGSNS